jgi:hypothetical protein
MKKVSLKEHLSEKIKSIEEKFELNLKLNQLAIDKAEIKINERMEVISRINDDIKTLTKAKDVSEGKAGMGAYMFL